MTTRGPLLLLHGIMMSAVVWTDVVPLLGNHHEVIAPTAAGHRGGPRLAEKATIAALVDETERLLDARGVGRLHIAGNSMGAWMAIELARRGRALSVCAFSPAGFWTPGASDEKRASRRVRRTRRQVQLARGVAPVLFRSTSLRRLALRDIALHGERLTSTSILETMRDVACCSAAIDLLAPSESIAPLDPLPCPITLAWSASDRILPPQDYSLTARERLPRANHVLLHRVGHVPMIDDPRACAKTILATTGALVAPRSTPPEL